MIFQKEITLPDHGRGFHLITDHIRTELVDELPERGILHLFLKHTSAGLTINENADPSVRDDFETIMNKLVPENDPDYTHTAEGPDDMPAHVKSTLCGNELSIPVSGGKMNLGTWQGIYLCEFRNHPGNRKLLATVFS